MTYDPYPPQPQLYNNYSSSTLFGGYEILPSLSSSSSSSSSQPYAEEKSNSLSLVKEKVENIEGNLLKPNILNTSNRGYHAPNGTHAMKNTSRQDYQGIRDSIYNTQRSSSSNEMPFRFIVHSDRG